MARDALAERERALFDASHHCSAWRLRTGVWRANDAGEPSGSAGAPILAAMDGLGLVDCAVIVTRYFGGTKLGVGGLLRAYGEAASQALRNAPRRQGIPAIRLRIRYPYSHTSTVMRALERAGAAGVEHGFAGSGDRGEVSFTAPADAEGTLVQVLRDQTGATVTTERVGESILYAPDSQL